MAIQIPTKLKIGTRVIPISYEDLASSNTFGFYDSFKQAIVLDKNIKAAQLAETFWHEVMHAIFDYIRFGMEMAKEMDDKDTPDQDAFKVEEYAAEGVAKTLLMVLKDNDLTKVI